MQYQAQEPDCSGARAAMLEADLAFLWPNNNTPEDVIRWGLAWCCLRLEADAAVAVASGQRGQRLDCSCSDLLWWWMHTQPLVQWFFSYTLPHLSDCVVLYACTPAALTSSSSRPHSARTHSLPLSMCL